MSGTASLNLEAALAYAQRGWLVLPIHSVQDSRCSCGRATCTSVGKHPRTTHGLKDATRNETQIQDWWTQWPDANVGIVTGAPSKLVVLDIDPRNGGEDSLAALERTHGALPQTVVSRTGGGGEHIFFQHPGKAIKSRPIAAGVDVKADGGYVVAPPSNHQSGELYLWKTSRQPEDLPLAVLPAWLGAQLTHRTEPLSTPSAGTPAKKMCQGQRNKNLASMAGAMRRQGADQATILQALKAHNRDHCEPPLPEHEVNQIAGSIARYQPATESNTAEANSDNGKPGSISCADRLIQIFEESHSLLFHDQFQDAYASISVQGHREVMRIHSKNFREWLAYQQWLKQGKASTNEGLQGAIAILSAQAKFTGPEQRL